MKIRRVCAALPVRKVFSRQFLDWKVRCWNEKAAEPIQENAQIHVVSVVSRQAHVLPHSLLAQVRFGWIFVDRLVSQCELSLDVLDIVSEGISLQGSPEAEAHRVTWRG